MAAAELKSRYKDEFAQSFRTERLTTRLQITPAAELFSQGHVTSPGQFEDLAWNGAKATVAAETVAQDQSFVVRATAIRDCPGMWVGRGSYP